MADIARTIQSMLDKLTEDEKDAFNFVIGLARMQPAVPRGYTVTLLGQTMEDRTNYTRRTVDVMAYSRDEAMAQARAEIVPNGEWWSAIVEQCTPTIPKGTDS